MAVNASNTAAQTASGASAAPVAEQILADLAPTWMHVALTAGPPLLDTLRQAAANNESQDSADVPPTSPRPELKHPGSELPVAGDRPYIPPKQKGNPDVVKNPQGRGYVDEKGNIWI